MCLGGKWGQLAAFRAVVATSSGAVEANPRFLGTNKNWDRVRSRRWPRGEVDTLRNTRFYLSRHQKLHLYKTFLWWYGYEWKICGNHLLAITAPSASCGYFVVAQSISWANLHSSHFHTPLSKLSHPSKSIFWSKTRKSPWQYTYIVSGMGWWWWHWSKTAAQNICPPPLSPCNCWKPVWPQ